MGRDELIAAQQQAAAALQAGAEMAAKAEKQMRGGVAGGEAARLGKFANSKPSWTRIPWQPGQ